MFLMFVVIRSGSNRLEVIHGSFRLGCREGLWKGKDSKIPVEAVESPSLGNISGQDRQASIRTDMDITNSALE